MGKRGFQLSGNARKQKGAANKTISAENKTIAVVPRAKAKPGETSTNILSNSSLAVFNKDAQYITAGEATILRRRDALERKLLGVVFSVTDISMDSNTFCEAGEVQENGTCTKDNPLGALWPFTSKEKKWRVGNIVAFHPKVNAKGKSIAANLVRREA